MEREHGRIILVSTRTLGSTLTADVAAGATVLPVHDAGDFDPGGGSLSLNGTVLTYVTCDDDASTVTLSAGLGAAALEDDRVDAWSTLYSAAFTEKTAMVQLDGDDDNPDPIEATVPHFLVDKLADGDRGGPGESVVVGYDEDEDEWTILDVLGLAGASGAGVKFCDTDTFTVAAAGDQSISLSHTPIDGSMHVAWEGVHQPASEWTLDGSILTLPDPGGLIVVGDVIDPRYAYRDGPVSAPFSPLNIPSLVAWYSADYEAQSLADGAAMTQWTDLSGKGNHAPVSGAGSGTGNPIFRATLGQAGGPCVEYALGYWFLVPAALASGIPGAEIMATIRAAGDNNGTGHWAISSQTSSVDAKYADTSGQIRDMFCLSGPEIFTPTLSISSWRRYGVSAAQGGDWIARMDETSQHTRSGISFFPAGGALGNRNLSSSGKDQTLWHGAVFLFADVLSDGDRASMTQWLKDHPSGGRAS